MSQYPTFAAGQKLTAATLQQVVPIRVAKATDQSVTSSTTLVSDNDLTIPVVASATYDLDGWLVWVGNETGNIKIAWNAPSGATLDWGMLGPHDSDTGFASGGTHGAGEYWAPNALTSFPTATNHYSGSTANLHGRVSGRLQVGATAGNLTLQWAQNTSNGTATKMRSGSWLHALRVA